MQKIYTINNLSVFFNSKNTKLEVVKGISFEIMDGICTAIVGESGSGKTVTAKAMMGLVRKPGEVSSKSLLAYKGKNLNELSQKEWDKIRGKEISMIFQDALVSLNPTKKVGKQIIEPIVNHYPKTSKSEMYDKALETLSMLKINDVEGVYEKYPHELSGGMRQRIMIASAIINRPSLLLADEPTTALDVTVQAQIIKLLKEIQMKMNMSIVLISHNLGVVAEIADYIIVMKDGSIVEEGYVDDIFYKPKTDYTKLLLESVPTLN